jgi:hypothetical protein
MLLSADHLLYLPQSAGRPQIRLYLALSSWLKYFVLSLAANF